MADSEMLKAALAEVKRLEAELAATAAYQKLQLAKQVVELYQRIPTAQFSIGGRRVEPREITQHLHTEVALSALTTKTARIEAAAAKYLRGKGARAPASELLGAVEMEGIEIGGREPVKALSSYLSNSKMFNNQRELGGYGLTEWGFARGPDLLTETEMEK
jgi:hypothetical protein